jgi:hypothetical protein
MADDSDMAPVPVPPVPQVPGRAAKAKVKAKAKCMAAKKYNTTRSRAAVSQQPRLALAIG